MRETAGEIKKGLFTSTVLSKKNTIIGRLGKQKITWTVSCLEKLNEKLFIYRPLPTIIGVELLDKGVLTPLTPIPRYNWVQLGA